MNWRCNLLSEKKIQNLFVLAIILFLSFPQNLFPQEYGSNVHRPDRWFLGGNLGLQFGTLTILDVSPYAGYKLTNQLSIGSGFTYQFLKEGKGENSYSSSVYGGRIFASYAIIPEIFAYAEYEVLNVEVAIDANDYARKNLSSALIGGGYRQMIGPNIYSDIMILWNLTESPNSPYSNPIYRVGFVIGYRLILKLLQVHQSISPRILRSFRYEFFHQENEHL